MRKLIGVVGIVLLGVLFTDSKALAQEFDPEYVKVTNQRAGKIVANMNIEGAEKQALVQNYIAQQYRNLSLIHDERDEKIQKAMELHEGARKENKIRSIEKKADKKLDKLHRKFLGQLSAELSEDQIEQVKDGLTYNVAPNTFEVYQAMIPDLSEDQKSIIWEWLVEAREYAMDASSSEEKHEWFGKYKGKINNYLSSLGHDLKQAEKNMYKRQANDR